MLISGKGNGAADWHQVLDAQDPVRDLATDEILAGKGDFHDSKKGVYPATARETRVCAYDRPNTRTTGRSVHGRASSPMPSTRTWTTSIACSSRSMHPSPTCSSRTPTAGSSPSCTPAHTPTRSAGSSWSTRDPPPSGAPSPPRSSTVWDQTNRIAAPGLESVEVADAVAKIDAAPPLHRMPSIVLTADKAMRADLQPVDADASVTFADWLAGQDLLATGLAAKQVTETNSGHTSTCTRPDS